MSEVQSDGKTVTVTTSEGHRIGFAMAELNVPSTAGEITTHWAGGVPPTNLETVVREAKAEAEAHVARHEASKPAEAQTAKEESKGVSGTLKDVLGLP